jgi:hypothetical protein
MNAITYLVDCACADMATGVSKAKRGDHAGAARLLARAQGELAKAEIRLHALARGAARAKEADRA